MTSPLTIWLQLTGILALEISLLAVLGALLHRFLPSAAWQRTLWQACLIAAITLLALELGGMARVFLPQSISKDSWRNRLAFKPFSHAQRNSLEQPRVASTECADSTKTIPDRQVSEGFRSPAAAKAAARPSRPASATPGLTSLISPPPVTAVAPRANSIATKQRSLENSVIIGFGLAWGIGFSTVLGRALLNLILFASLRRKWQAVADAQLHKRVQTLAQSLGMRRHVRLIESPGLVCPVAFGFLRPTIGLPSGFNEIFARSQQDAMLLHELAHLRAGDPVWRLVADIATALLWWHPLVWWMRRRMEAVSEIVADEASLLLADGPGALAECLVKLGAELAHGQPARSLGMAVTGFRSGLGRRVERLVHLKEQAWSPLCPRRSALARLAGALALVLTAILCTAWAVPAALTKGENMQTMQHTWKSSLAAFALLATLGTENHTAIAKDAVEPALTRPNPFVADAALTYAGTSQGPGRAAPPGNALPPGSITYQWQAGANATTPGVPGSVAPGKAPSKEKQAVEAKLKRITLDTVAYNGVPLGEVVQQLVDVAAKLDSDKIGINFLVKSETQPSPAGAAVIDPTTGLPVAPTEPVDLNNVIIKIEPPLKQMRLSDVLDAITKVADRPIKYSIEDYGVVFSLDQSKLPGSQFPMPASEPLLVKTFKVDTNTFSEGLEAAFGIRLPEHGAHQPQEIQEALRDLLSQLGINLDTQNKSIFYNKLTGILMVRGTQEDLAVVGAAIETLGGAEYSALIGGYPNFSPGAGISQPAAR